VKFKEVTGDRNFRITLTEREAEVLLHLIGKSATGNTEEKGIHELYLELENRIARTNFESDGYISVKKK